MYNHILQSPNFYKVGLYIRLSEADLDKAYESESESIINQRNLLMNYVKQCGFTLVDEYVDDGFTGTNFDRPGFTRMINDIENGKINCVITKDLSRLGRDYIKCGYYVEQYFPSKKVRYISILDQIDTFLESANNDIAPFKALFNDMTSKDTSKKIRSILKNKKEQGKFIGSEPSYGYMRDPLDKGHLIPNPDTAFIVKKIFKMAYDGAKISDIVSYLNSQKYPTPSSLKRKNPHSKAKYNKSWTSSSVSKILKNPMYIGNMVQNLQTKLSYKSKKKVCLDECFWIVVEGTHEPLVSKSIFESVSKNPRRMKKTFKNRPKRLLENLLECKECGNTLTVVYRQNKNYWTVNCNKYARDPRLGLCQSHFMPYDKLERIVLERIKKTFKKNLSDFDVILLSNEIKKISDKYVNVDEEKKNLLDKIEELQKKIDILYDDRLKENISIDTYLRLSSNIEDELNTYRNNLNDLNNNKINNLDNKNNDEIIKSINKLIDIDNPTRELIKSFVDKIVIDANRNIEIIYKFKNCN